jgi:periplasmic protein TonB
MATTFEAFLAHQGAAPTARGRRVTYALSIAVHGAAVAAGIIYSFWRVDEVTPPPQLITALTFVAPPPPPPPPAGGKVTATKTPTKVRRREIVQPTPDKVVQPEKVEEKPEVTAELDGEKDGEEGGEKGGIKGGVKDGTGHELTGAPPQAAWIEPTVARGQLAIDPQSDQYRVKLPPALARTGMALWALVKVCAAGDGQVRDVKIVRPADPTLDPLIVATLRTWRYRPYTINGRPVPFCTNVRYEISTR